MPVSKEELWRQSMGAVKPDWGLLPWEGVVEVARVMAWSEARKHSGGDWRTRSVRHHAGKAVGHIVSHITGHELDDESGLPSLAHAAARALMCVGVYVASTKCQPDEE